MTIDGFKRIFKAVAKNVVWRISNTRSSPKWPAIRTGERYETCPLTYLIFVKTGKKPHLWELPKAATIAGMSEADARKIMDAADGKDHCDRELRAFLLEAIGHGIPQSC